ncbi:MAG: hypothetical protein HY665_07755 [Chloroflexi bacterium]|nr:hypothetical protein [Chloroflexota bacterium]
MENALIALISIAMIVTGALTITKSSFSSMDALSESWKGMQARTSEIARTSIEGTTSNFVNPSYMDVSVQNNGSVSLRDFASWDIVVRYTSEGNTYHIVWLPYTDNATPGANQWTVKEMLYGSGTEVFEPGILNPQEVVVVRMNLSPRPKPNVVQYMAISTPNGVATSIMFERN